MQPIQKQQDTNAHLGHANSLREYWREYWPEVLFGVVLAAVVFVSTYLSQFIPVYSFDYFITPALNVCTSSVCLVGAFIIYRHTDGMRMRRFFAHALVLWGLGDLFYLVCYLLAPMKVMNMGAEHLTTFELLFGNLLGWVMTLYPTEALRPGWLKPKVVVWQLLPLFALAVLDYVVPIDFWPVIALYPYALLIVVLSHIREYRIWCENNYSSMDNIDVQWIIRYCIMLFILGANYVYMLSGHGHTRAFTQQWFIIFMAIYSTEQILFRRDPWAGLRGEDEQAAEDAPAADAGEHPDGISATDQADYVRILEQWMESEKPYLNPAFQLTDLRAVLPMNRTYLSEFIKNAYGCTFYQFVNAYRVEEAKRLMKEHPRMKYTDVGSRAGFSSPVVFSRVFVRLTGLTPKEWSAQ